MSEKKICSACGGTGSVSASHPAISEDKLRAMIREMVAEALAKPSEPQPVEDAIVNCTCEECGENYVGLFTNMPSGWYMFVEQGTWEKPAPRKEYAFCSEEHMKQWQTKHKGDRYAHTD